MKGDITQSTDWIGSRGVICLLKNGANENILAVYQHFDPIEVKEPKYIRKLPFGNNYFNRYLS